MKVLLDSALIKFIIKSITNAVIRKLWDTTLRENYFIDARLSFFGKT